MKLTMVSHASVLVEDSPICICTDPWFIGDAFNESWSLLCEPALSPAALQRVTHIWISHEHPDHLNFPTLKAIPVEQKTRITLLYQQHFSPRMVQTLSKLGFRQVLELPLARWFDIGHGVSVMCCSIGSIDSLLAVRSKGVIALNVNDCVMKPLATRSVSRQIGRVDVLLIQFSIACWVGNPGDTDVPARHEIIDRMRRCIQTFRPRVTIPFASFVYFSHNENRYMNAWINTPDHVHEELSNAPTQLQFLYNGDSWSNESGFCLHGDPLKRYKDDFNKIPELPYRSHPSYPLDELLTLGRKLVKKVWRSFPWLLLRRVAPIYFYIIDLGTVICFNLRSGIVEADQRSREHCDIALSSQALWFAFKFSWGFSTLDVSGRYELINPKVNRLALYLCHLYCSDIHCNGLWRRLCDRRVWSFCWSKRYEVLDRLHSSIATVVAKIYDNLRRNRSEFAATGRAWQ
jgi:UDP-MurNAc hydroxylase